MDKNTELILNALSKRIGGTPVIKAGGVFCKLESRNPAGSIKDRTAFYIIKDAVESGLLKEGGALVEATSGNTGIGLAYVCRELGLKFTATMPSSMSKERIALMESYGAEVLLTPAEKGMSGAVEKAAELAKGGAFLADQFGNVSGIKAHFETTAPEIFTELPDLGCVVCGVGTGGTYFGIKKFVEQNKLDCKVIAVEPAESPLLSKGYAGAHKIQGIGANFVPKLVDKSKIDCIMTVESDSAVKAVKSIFVESGEKCGISSGAAYLAAKRYLALNPDAKCLAVFPDGGDRYDESLYK